MDDTDYQRMEYRAGKRKIILEFPGNPVDTGQIEAEIREILSCELRERTKNFLDSADT